jgi:hypothetical protein
LTKIIAEVAKKPAEVDPAEIAKQLEKEKVRVLTCVQHPLLQLSKL